MQATSKIEALLEASNSDLLSEHAFINLKDARVKFSKIVNAARLNSNKVVITNHGEPAAAIVPIEALRIIDIFDKAGLYERMKDESYRDLTRDKAREILISLGLEVSNAKREKLIEDRERLSRQNSI